MLANPPFQKVRRTRKSHDTLVVVGWMLLLTLVVGLVCAWLMLQTVAGYYAGRFYPNVYVMGIKLGRLTPGEAVALLDEAARDTETGVLVLRVSSTGLTTVGSTELTTSGSAGLPRGDERWSIPWSEAGLHIDVKATVQAAFAVGHRDDLNWRERMRNWLQRHDVAPVFAVDPARAREALERLAPSVAITPTDATLRLPQNEEEAVVAVPGRPGRELDIEATLAQLLAVARGQALETGVDLVFRAVPPRITDASTLQAQVEEMLQRQIQVVTHEVLSGETFSWTLGRSEFITWLRVAPTTEGPTVELGREGIGATLARLAVELGGGRGFRQEEAVEQVARGFESGGGTVSLYLTHPPRKYAVQAGDSLSSITAAFGLTAWHVMRANPGLDPDWLSVGQELTIPSQDELTPFTPVVGKRVVVSVAEQRMRAYESGQLVYDWPVSTGVARSPTHRGVFQVLGKEERAYASLWDLWMPHFVAIYAAGPDFYNGFHGLPTLSSGRRLWEGLLGSPASYGCIILGLEEAESFYTWTELGVVVVVE